MEKKEIRKLVADLIESAGCGCCRNDKVWEEAQEKLAELLNVPMYADKSGYNFGKFITKR